MTEVYRSLEKWSAAREGLGSSIGFVPTMGALHEGHLSLVRESRDQNDVTVVSIFVNPTQFNDPDDLRNYPRNIERDLEILKKAQADFVILPDERDIYPDEYCYRVAESKESRILCGAHRPGHFEGVLTVVLKLLQVSGADRAYFGEKDYQQYRLIDQMARAFFLKTRVIPRPIIREPDGLAMSSRNQLLLPEHRRLAPEFIRTLKQKKSCDAIRAELERAGFKVDYVEEHWGRRLGAVRLGKVRLIDNVEI